MYKEHLALNNLQWFIYKKKKKKKKTPNHTYLIYMHKKESVLDHLQRLICHRNQLKQVIYLIHIYKSIRHQMTFNGWYVVKPNQTKPNHIFLSLRVFGQLSSSLLLFPQSFGRYVLRPSSVVCRTREPTQNFELRPLLNPRVGFRVREPPEEGRRTYRPKHRRNNNKDEENSTKTLDNENHQASS